jgi:hypothetical protein
MPDGIRTTNLERQFAIDEVIGNVTDEGVEKTARIPLSALVNAMAGTGAFIFGNTVYALAEADLPAPTSDTQGAVVLDDPDASKNGYYAVVADDWVFGRGFPDSIAKLTVTGGTANAVQAMASAGVDPSNVKAFYIDITTPNAGNVTVAINGAAAIPAYNINGAQFAPGEWNGRIFLSNEGESLKALVDPAAAASAAASAAAAAASAAAAAAGLGRPFDNIAAAEIYAPVTAPELLQVAGYSLPGDFGDAASYVKVVSDPAPVPGFQITLDDGVTTAWYKNTSKDLTPEHCGAAGDGVTDDSDALYTWLMAAAEEGRKAVTLGGKTYMVEDPVIAIIEKGLTVEGVKGTTIKGVAGEGIVLEIRNNAISNSALYPDLSFSGLTIDNSLRDFDAAAQSGTGLSLVRMGKAEIFNSRFMGDPLFDADPIPANWTKGDSGVTAVTCLDLNIHDNYFAHQPDLALYVSGGPDNDASSDDFGEWKIYSNQLVHCNVGFAAKRQTRRVLFTQNIVRRMLACGYLGTAGALGNGGVGMISAREQMISNNIFSEMEQRAIELELSAGDVISNNQIIDWGCLLSNFATASANPIAMRLFGVNGASIVGNKIRLRSMTNSANHTAMQLRASTFSGTVETTSCIVDDNDIAGCTKGIIELNSANSNLIGDANRFSAAVTERITKASGSSSGGYTIQADASPAFGTVNTGGRVQVSVSVTGVEEGDTAIYQPGGATVFINGIVYQTRCTTGAVLIDARNTSGGNIAVPTVTGKLRIFKPKP